MGTKIVTVNCCTDCPLMVTVMTPTHQVLVMDCMHPDNRHQTLNEEQAARNVHRLCPLKMEKLQIKFFEKNEVRDGP